MQAVLTSKMRRFAAAASIFIPRTAHNYRKGNPSAANTLLFRTHFSTNPNPPNVVATTNPLQLQKLLEKSKMGFDKLDDALSLFHQMARTQPLPSLVHFNRLLTAVAEMKEYSTVLSLYKEIRELGISTDECTSLVLMNCFCCVLEGLVGNQEFGEAVEVLRLMQDQGMVPGVDAYGIVLNGMCKAGKIEDARKLFETASAGGLRPNVEMYTYMVRELCKADLLDEAEELLVQMEKDGCPPDVVAYGMVINGMCKAGKIEDARKLFGTALAGGLKPNVEMYTYMVMELCKADLLDEGEELLVQMEKDGCPPDAVTYNIIVRAFIEKGARHKVMTLLEEMNERSFPPDASTMSKLVDCLTAEVYLEKYVKFVVVACSNELIILRNDVIEWLINYLCFHAATLLSSSSVFVFTENENFLCACDGDENAFKHHHVHTSALSPSCITTPDNKTIASTKSNWWDVDPLLTKPSLSGRCIYLVITIAADNFNGGDWYHTTMPRGILETRAASPSVSYLQFAFYELMLAIEIVHYVDVDKIPLHSIALEAISPHV
ncbi:pentatricopeptide repeat-containing protein At5g16640, mitochondrial-like [Rhododendron vialii]|uniref:pentatricopeptide repeat-containing protein At5g16640, mitochondrial-like n=1 Tax=Rhododendron vialii TaxID=182163 RepID=UPI00265F01E1|nr:pentatricopeptide repeat-containing protein At5g16640, mitochondrial-like [Rhododendron vialii]